MAKLVDKFIGRLRLKAPRVMAVLEGELPLKDGEHVFTAVNRTDRIIPNCVYQTWRSCQFGKRHLAGLEQFRALNADCSFIFFNDAQMDLYMAEYYGSHPIKHIYDCALYGPLKTDIWRYCILYERGGFYCDIGKSISTPLRDLVGPDTGALISYERNLAHLKASELVVANAACPENIVNNWAMGFKRHHPLLRAVIDGIVMKYPSYSGVLFPHPKNAILSFTGPIHLTECWHAYLSGNDVADIHQAGVDFYGHVVGEIPGSYSRFTSRGSYAIVRFSRIV